MDRMNRRAPDALSEGHRRFLEARQQRVEALRETLLPWLPRERDLVLEIGCGHGHFLTAYAAAHPEQVCVGIDLVSRRIRKALAKRDKEGLRQLQFLKAEVTEFLDAWPETAYLQRIFVLYPDPWPKKRHIKNRILQPAVLDRLAEISASGATLHFRTDHPGNFEWVYETIKAHPCWHLRADLAWPFENPSFFQDLLGIHESLSAIREA